MTTCIRPAYSPAPLGNLSLGTWPTGRVATQTWCSFIANWNTVHPNIPPCKMTTEPNKSKQRQIKTIFWHILLIKLNCCHWTDDKHHRHDLVWIRFSLARSNQDSEEFSPTSFFCFSNYTEIISKFRLQETNKIQCGYLAYTTTVTQTIANIVNQEVWWFSPDDWLEPCWNARACIHHASAAWYKTKLINRPRTNMPLVGPIEIAHPWTFSVKQISTNISPPPRARDNAQAHVKQMLTLDGWMPTCTEAPLAFSRWILSMWMTNFLR